MSTTEGTTSGFDVEQGQYDGSFFAQSDDNGSFAYSLPFANEDSFRSSSSSSEGSGQPEEDQGRPGKSNFSDGSEPLFSMYLRRTEEEDRKTAKSWKGYADGMLVFTGLFSAAVAVLLAVTVQDIRPNPQDISAFYLARINQQLSSQLNEPQDPIPTSLSNNPARSFSAPTWAVWVNGLWFLSLVISLTCALMATLLQQWARRYLEVAYPRYRPHERARIRAFYSEGVKKLRVPWTVEALPTLLHISLFFFFAGLAVFLFNVHLTVFAVVIAWIGICVILYACITLLPIICKNSPYTGPLSTFVSFCVTGMRLVFLKLSEKFRRNLGLPIGTVPFFSRSMRKTAEDYASRLHGGIYLRALWWTYNSLVEDGELQEFFEGIPGLCRSKAVPNALRDFIKPHAKALADELMELMNRTLSSDLVSESVKQKRIVIFSKVIDATQLFGDKPILCLALLKGWDRFLRSVEYGIFAQKEGKKSHHRVKAFFAQCSVAAVISNVRERDENWYELVFGQLNIPKPLLYDKLSYGDSILLANLMFVVRRIVKGYSGSRQSQKSDLLHATSKTLKYVCKFDVKNTLPEFQHEFCDLWNKLAERTENDRRPPVKRITKTVLKHTRKLYDALHQGTDDATPYPRCPYAEHHPTSSVEELQFDEPPLVPSPISAHTPTPPAEELQFDEPPLVLSLISTHTPTPSVIPPSPGLPPASAMPASNSVPSFHSHTSVPALSS